MSSNERNPFAREESGLVSLEGYLPYLINSPDEAPIYLPFNDRRDWVYQHVYFQEANYRQDGIPHEDKDMNLVWMRHISYNQVMMKPRMELKLHQDHETDVEPPHPETVTSCLNDYNRLDSIGAAIVGKMVALNPEVHPVVSPGGGHPAMRYELSPDERADFFDEMFEAQLKEAQLPLVIPERIVTSALKRMSVLLGDARLKDEAWNRLKDDKTYYPLRMPKTSRLYHISNELIVRAFTEDLSAEYAA